jgi:hypothetical protein
MDKREVEKMLRGIDPPTPDKPSHQEELKIPLLSDERSSEASP